MDKSYQEWAKLSVSAQKEGLEVPEQPNVQEMYDTAMGLIKQTMTQPKSTNGDKNQQVTPEMMQAILGQQGGGMM